jgi:hypothetical protein
VSSFFLAENLEPAIVYRLLEYYQHDFGVMQHPLSIWNLSYGKVLNAIYEILELLINSANDETKHTELLQKYEHLLYLHAALINDDTKSIIDCFFTEDQKENKTVKEQVRQPSVEAHSSKIINQIKHHRRHIVTVNHYLDELIIPGFTIVQNFSGTASFCTTVHHRAGDTVFSFYYELRHLFVGIYIISEALCNVVPSVSKPSTNLTQSPKIKQLLELFLKLPRIYLPNELKKEIPFIEHSTDSSNSGYFHIGTGTNKKYYDIPNLTNYKQLTQKIHFTGDGVTRNFSLFDVY